LVMFMSNVWLETFLGDTGMSIIRFIDSYYFYFIPIILVYGIFITLSSYNLKRLEKKISADIISQARKIVKNYPDINYVNLMDRVNIDWGNLIKEYSFFPYVTHESGFWVKRTNVINVRALIMHYDRKMHNILNRHGIVFIKQKKPIRENLYLEYMQRITRNK